MWVASAAFSSRFRTTCWICEESHGQPAGSSSRERVSTSTLLSFILCWTRESVVRTMRLRSAGARCGLERREKASRSRDDAADARRLAGDLAEVLAEFVDAGGRDAVVLEHALQQHREVQDAGDRVVDLVRDAGGELAEGGEAVAVEELLLRGLELLGALLHLAFEVLRELVDFVERGAQAFAHDVEGAGEFVELFAAAVDVDGLVELHLADGLGAVDELLDGAAEEAAGEVEDEEADERDLDAR